MSESAVLAAVHDHVNHALRVSPDPSFNSECNHSETEIWNDVFDIATETIRIF